MPPVTLQTNCEQLPEQYVDGVAFDVAANCVGEVIVAVCVEVQPLASVTVNV